MRKQYTLFIGLWIIVGLLWECHESTSPQWEPPSQETTMLTWSQDGGYPPPSNSETVTQSLFVVEWDNRATIAEYYATGRWKVRASSIVSDSLVTALRDTFRQYNFSALDSAYTGLVADVGSERITYCADPTTPNICTSVLVGEGAEFPPTFQSIRSTLQRIREHLLAN